jgi:VRR-NUC domain
MTTVLRATIPGQPIGPQLRSSLELETRVKRRRAQRLGTATEHQEQATVCDWLRAHRVVYFAVPNGGSRSAVAGARLRRIGLKAGVPDLVILSAPAKGWVSESFRGVAVEMKRAKGGVVSPLQDVWLEQMKACGWATAVAHGADAAIEFLKSLGYGV